MKLEDIEYFKKIIPNYCLEGFGNEENCSKLVFCKEDQDLYIIVLFKCSIKCKNSSIESLVQPFSIFSNKYYTLAYFIPLNLKRVQDCIFTKSEIIFRFENDEEIYFILADSLSQVSIFFTKSYSINDNKEIKITLNELSELYGK